jgi:succinyl-diaminopimelate desuccinylase
MRALDPTDPVALAQALVRCRSVTPEEGGALTLLQQILGPAGFDCHRLTMREAGTPDVENLYARLGTSRPHLCFAGHTDVVPPGDAARWTHPPFDGVIADGMLWGRGAVDMKGAIASFVAAFFRRAKAGALNGSVSLLITGDEEGPSINGTAKVLDWMAARGDRVDACVVGEPSNPSELGQEIKIGRRGSLTGDLAVAGRQGHVAYPHLADNPVPALARIVDRLSGLRLDSGTADFEPSCLQVTVLSTATNTANVIPAEARAKFNIRYNTQWTRARLETLLRDEIGKVAGTAAWSVAFSGTGDVFLTKPGPLVAAMADAVQAVTGREAKLTTNGGTSDARFIQAYCPVVEFGLTNALAHHVDERVALADLETLTQVYERFIARYFGAV